MRVMKYFMIATIVFVASLQAVEAGKYQSAHVVPVSLFQGNTYVIFGLTKKGQLDDFGGLRDRGETDSKMTAAREAEEEALGVLGSKYIIRQRLRGSVSVVDKDRGHPHYILPARNYGPIFSTFKNKRYGTKGLTSCQKEMLELIAIRIEEVRKGVKLYDGHTLKLKGPNGKLYPVRRGTSGSIIRAVKKGYL